MNKISIISILLVGLVASVHMATIEPALEDSLKTKPTVDVIVSMKEGTDKVLDSVNKQTYKDRGEKATAVNKALRDHAAKTQKPLLEYLETVKQPNGLTFSSIYISNAVIVKKATPEVVRKIATFDDVGTIDEDKIVSIMG